MKMAYYPGCSLKQSSALCDVQSRAVFEQLGVELKEIRDWNCCGATSAAKMDDFLAVGMAARNIGIAEAAGYAEMVIPCSACYSRTMVAKYRMADDPGLAEDINEELKRPVSGSLQVLSVIEGLTAQADAIQKQRTRTYSGLKPVCYYGCMLTRFPADVPVSDNVENPQGMEDVLSSIKIKSLDWNMKTACCGASAAVTDTETADALMAEILKDAHDRGANCIVATCPMCQMNLDLRQEEIGKAYGFDRTLPVYFLTELVGASLGLSPEQLQLDRHFLDGISLLHKAQDKDAEDKEAKAHAE